MAIPNEWWSGGAGQIETQRQQESIVSAQVHQALVFRHGGLRFAGTQESGQTSAQENFRAALIDRAADRSFTGAFNGISQQRFRLVAISRQNPPACKLQDLSLIHI